MAQHVGTVGDYIKIPEGAPKAVDPETKFDRLSRGLDVSSVPTETDDDSCPSQNPRPVVMLTLAGLSLPGMTRVRSSLTMVGHQRDSMCSITSSVPRAWLTKGRVRGSYMVWVRSRTRTTLNTSRVICRAPNERLRMQIFVCTPMSAIFVMPSCLQKL